MNRFPTTVMSDMLVGFISGGVVSIVLNTLSFFAAGLLGAAGAFFFHEIIKPWLKPRLDAIKGWIKSKSKKNQQ
jgi:hypothetical protein